MTTKNPKVDAYLKRAQKWQAEMEELRKILLGSEMTEELKWGKPCYAWEGSNVVIMVAFKEYCALLFCKGALLKDPKGILIQPTENTQAARQLRFTEVKEIVKMKATVKAYVQEALAVEQAGLEVVYKKITEFSVPEELQQEFTESPAFEKSFRALTPGRQRGYLLFFSSAKQAKTRTARIEKNRERIFEGKGLDD